MNRSIWQNGKPGKTGLKGPMEMKKLPARSSAGSLFI